MSSRTGQHPQGRLAAICELLGSSKDGERATAALKATEILQRLGLTWTELIRKAFTPAPPAPPSNTFNPFWNQYAPPAPPQGDMFGQNTYSQPGWEPQHPWARPPRQQAKPTHSASKGGFKLWDLIRYALARSEQLSDWERRFVHAKNAIGPKVKATEAEWRCMLQIAEKLGLEPQQ